MSKEQTESSHKNMFEVLADSLSQSEAAMIAVIAAHKVEDWEHEKRQKPTGSDNTFADSNIQFFSELEEAMLESIKNNDGKVVYWIGQAAKQINPLLS